MILFLDGNKVASWLMDNQRNPHADYIGYELDETKENKSIIGIVITETERVTVINGVLQVDGVAAIVAQDTDKAQIKAEYTATIDTLQTIENYTSPTNAQIIAAVKFLAKTVRLILKLMSRRWL